MSENKMIAGAIGGTLLIAIFTLSYMQRQQENALIASGRCEVEITELYQPPPTMSCSHQIDGVCGSWVPITHDAYRRDLWVCDEASEFWRKTKERARLLVPDNN